MSADPGTITYMPRELLLSGRMTQSTDIYSFGLMSEQLAYQHWDLNASVAAVDVVCMMPFLPW